MEHREDVRRASGTQLHRHVNYYVSLHPNPDAQKMKKVKPFRERKTPYADTISDMKRPFDHPRDMPTHVVHHLEVRDLPTLPRNLDWCFPELNMYAQTNHFTAVDNKHGEPDNFDVPSQVHVDWCRWAHERTVNEGYSPEDSHKWLLERELYLKDVVKGMPPPTLRRQLASPDGLFPQNWPDPDAPDEMNTDSHLLAALVLDDYDHRVPSNQVFPNVNFRDTLDAEGRIREAGLLMGVPANQVQDAVVYAQERVRSQEVQQNERYVLHRRMIVHVTW
eukprot:3563761-Amphidinium_carterae.1